MQLMIQALQKVGPDLTRARLRQVLNSMTFSSGLTKDEHWLPQDHYANTSMLGFTIQDSGGFNGFQYQNTGWFADPWASLDR
jgi:ABC-type branched-subunit amino acid transport system substrate-binding protein